MPCMGKLARPWTNQCTKVEQTHSSTSISDVLSSTPGDKYIQKRREFLPCQHAGTAQQVEYHWGVAFLHGLVHFVMDVLNQTRDAQLKATMVGIPRQQRRLEEHTPNNGSWLRRLPSPCRTRSKSNQHKVEWDANMGGLERNYKGIQCMLCSFPV